MIGSFTKISPENPLPKKRKDLLSYNVNDYVYSISKLIKLRT